MAESDEMSSSVTDEGCLLSLILQVQRSEKELVLTWKSSSPNFGRVLVESLLGNWGLIQLTVDVILLCFFFFITYNFVK